MLAPKEDKLSSNNFINSLILFLSFEDLKAESLLMRLDLAGFSVSSGSACSSGKVKASHVLKAMNINESMQKGAIRVSLGWGSSKEQVESFISFFENIFNKKVKE